MDVDDPTLPAPIDREAELELQVCNACSYKVG
jgi:hypothetical protein